MKKVTIKKDGVEASQVIRLFSFKTAQKQRTHFDESDRENEQTSKTGCDSVEMKCRFSAIMSMDFGVTFFYAVDTFCRGT